MTYKSLPIELITLLADGNFHSGEVIGELLGVSRAAVWKKLQGLASLGLQIESVKGKGYCLAEPLTMFNKSRLDTFCKKKNLPTINIFDSIDSTNAELLRQLANNQAEHGSSVVAEMQKQGRGRRGKVWISPFAKNMYFSTVVSFSSGAANLEGLSLVVGLSLIRVLATLGLPQAKLKWPNDVLVDNKKLAGILLEITGDPTGLCHVVVGVGVNVNMRQTVGQIDQAWTSLCQQLGEVQDKSNLLMHLITELQISLRRFSKQGFKPFLEEWMLHDAFLNRSVVVKVGEQMIFGESLGVNDRGELLLNCQGVIRSFNGGEVSLRMI